MAEITKFEDDDDDAQKEGGRKCGSILFGLSGSLSASMSSYSTTCTLERGCFTASSSS
jgi:hypothetical protein